MLSAAVSLDAPVVIRYPRGKAISDESWEAGAPLEVGKAEVMLAGGSSAVWLWALGDMVPVAIETAALLKAAGVDAGVVNARFVRPLDVALLASQLSSGAACIATLENGSICSGFGSAVLEAVSDIGAAVPVVRCGWPDVFVEQGSPAGLMEKYGLTAPAVVERIRKIVKNSDGE